MLPDGWTEWLNLAGVAWRGRLQWAGFTPFTTGPGTITGANAGVCDRATEEKKKIHGPGAWKLGWHWLLGVAPTRVLFGQARTGRRSGGTTLISNHSPV